MILDLCTLIKTLHPLIWICKIPLFLDKFKYVLLKLSSISLRFRPPFFRHWQTQFPPLSHSTNVCYGMLCSLI